MQRDLEARGGGMRRDKGVCLAQRNQSVRLRHFVLVVLGGWVLLMKRVMVGSSRA